MPTGNVIVGKGIAIADGGIHDRIDMLASLVGMRKAESVSELVERDALNVVRPGAQCSPIRIE